MADLPKIYIDTCPLVDMAQEKAGVTLEKRISDGVWFCKEVLRASRDKKVRVFTSFLTIAECASIQQGVKPSNELMAFLDQLLVSGKSGIELIAVTQAIATRARNLRWDDGMSLGGADSIHVASALALKCDEFWTRDGKIYKNRDKISPYGLTVRNPSDTVLLPDEYRTLGLGLGLAT